jgi:hypothetical protein
MCRFRRLLAQVAQLVEQRTENPRVDGSIPPLGTSKFRLGSSAARLFWLWLFSKCGGKPRFVNVRRATCAMFADVFRFVRRTQSRRIDRTILTVPITKLARLGD